jgi:hypothetical protein
MIASCDTFILIRFRGAQQVRQQQFPVPFLVLRAAEKSVAESDTRRRRARDFSVRKLRGP